MPRTYYATGLSAAAGSHQWSASPDFVAKDGELATAKPKTIAEALDELEGKVGKDGRRKFEKFLREVAEDEDEDVESK